DPVINNIKVATGRGSPGFSPPITRMASNLATSISENQFLRRRFPTTPTDCSLVSYRSRAREEVVQRGPVISLARANVHAGAGAIRGRRHPDQFAKHSAKVTLIAETHLLADVRH